MMKKTQNLNITAIHIPLNSIKDQLLKFHFFEWELELLQQFFSLYNRSLFDQNLYYLCSILQQLRMYNHFYFINPYDMMSAVYQPAYFTNSLVFPYQSFKSVPPIQNTSLFPSEPSVKIEQTFENYEERHQIETKCRKARKSKKSKFNYPKKNVESNVVNQCFSFLISKAKSYAIGIKILGCEEKLTAFYEILRLAKKKIKCYMGRNVLEEFLVIDQGHVIQDVHKKLTYKVPIKLSEIRKALRIMTFYFLKNIVITTILTSSKLDRSTINEHLTRARQIFSYLNQKPSLFI